jgi:Streptomycin adenylyltransferase
VSGEEALWQRRLADDVVALVGKDPSVKSIWLVGSLGSPEAAVDHWSDADVAVVVHDRALADWSGAVDWLRPIGQVWATNVSQEPLRQVTRVVFRDGRRLDLVFFGHTFGRPDLPGREIWSRQTTSELANHARLPAKSLPVVDAIDPTVNEFRFVAALAVVKLARGDELIGHHLAIECPRLCLVLGMLMRDAGVSASDWASLPAEVGQVEMPGDPNSALSAIEMSATIFEAHLHAAGYGQTLDPGPLGVMIAQLRAEIGLKGTGAARS